MKILSFFFSCLTQTYRKGFIFLGKIQVANLVRPPDKFYFYKFFTLQYNKDPRVTLLDLRFLRWSRPVTFRLKKPSRIFDLKNYEFKPLIWNPEWSKTYYVYISTEDRIWSTQIGSGLSRSNTMLFVCSHRRVKDS